MKKLCIIGLLLLITIGVSSPNIGVEFQCKVVEKCKIVQNFTLIDSTTAINDSVLIQYLTIKQFKDTLGKYESWNTYNITNKWGFKGKYQFSNYMIGRFAHVKPSYFLRNGNVQERAMDRVCAFYIDYIYKYGYDKYINTEIDGVTVTMESLMLGCHFSPLYLMWWLESNGQLNPRDANITIKDYMKRFENKGNIIVYKELICKK